MARRIDRVRGGAVASASVPVLVDGVEAVPAELLPLDLPRGEYSERGQRRREWFRARGIESDWNERRRAVAAGFAAAGIAEPDPVAFLRAASGEQPAGGLGKRRRGAKTGRE